MTTTELIVFALGAVSGAMLTITGVVVYMLAKGKWG